MSVRRLIPVSMVGAVAALAIVSCGQRSLIVMQVESASAGVTFDDVNLVVRARQEATRFDGVTFGDATNPLRAGVYLSSDISGTVVLNAEVDDPRQNCVVGMGTLTVGNVSPGNTVGGQTLLITPVMPCVPITDGGSVGDGGSLATGGAPATGGTMATGGRGGSQPAGGSVGTGGGGGIGPAGAPGSGGTAAGGTGGTGGMKATGGMNGHGGTGGIGGSAGMPGTGGIGGTGGMKGSGGMTATGGVLGSGGMVGAGGVLGSGGMFGSGGMGATGGTVSSGGMPGSGGSTGCKCGPNEICDSSGGCVCSQTAAEACAAAGYECGTTTDICGGAVSCGVCPLSFICSGGVCLSRCSPGTGGIVAESSDAICPVQTQ